MRFKGGNLRTLMVRAGWVLGLIVCLGGGLARADLKSPLIDGEYVVGELGVLRLATTALNGSKERFRLEGKYVSGTKCAFVSSEVLLEGVIDGTVLVATLKTCMEGSGCPTPNDIPLMGVIGEGSVTAYIDLPRGCSAPGLDSQKLTMQATPATLREVAGTYYGQQNFVRAAAVYRRLTETSEGASDFDVHVQLGSSYNGLKRYGDGRAAFRKAMSLPGYGAASAENRAVLLYNLACAEAGLVGSDPEAESSAVAHLKEAIEIGKKAPRLGLRENAAHDADLESLHANPEFQKLVGLKKGTR